MWNHALAMSDTMRSRGIGWPEFEDSELADLVAFLYFLPFADPPGDAQRGAEVFHRRSCAECHAGSEEQLATAASSSSELVAAMWDPAPVMKKAILSEGRHWPELTGDDLRDLYAYFQVAGGGTRPTAATEE